VSLTLPADPAQLKAQFRAQFPDEVVTHAHVRDVDLPGVRARSR